MQGALDTRAKLASPARKEDEERDEKSSQKLIGRLDRPHQQLFQQHRPTSDIAVLHKPPRCSPKQFFKLLVSAAAYRQVAVTTPEKLEKDPQNRLLSRGPRFRMDAEMVRDYALAASG